MNVESKSLKGEKPDGSEKSTTNLTELLLVCATQPDPMLSMLEWLCDRLMEAEISAKICADKSEHTSGRNSADSGGTGGIRQRRFHLSHGICRRLVGFKGLFQRRIHSQRLFDHCIIHFFGVNLQTSIDTTIYDPCNIF